MVIDVTETVDKAGFKHQHCDAYDYDGPAIPISAGGDVTLSPEIQYEINVVDGSTAIVWGIAFAKAEKIHILD